MMAGLFMVGHVRHITSDVRKQQEQKVGSGYQPESNPLCPARPHLLKVYNLLKQHPLLRTKCSITWKYGGHYILRKKLYLLTSGWKGIWKVQFQVLWGIFSNFYPKKCHHIAISCLNHKVKPVGEKYQSVAEHTTTLPSHFQYLKGINIFHC